MAKWSQKFACFNFASIINDLKYRTSFAILYFHSPPLFPTCNPAKYPFSMTVPAQNCMQYGAKFLVRMCRFALAGASWRKKKSL